jgi:sec-independent protein translocase protein TatA
MMISVLAMLQMPEIIALLVLALILFGAKKLPELAKGLGQGIKEFKKATRDVTDELHNAIDLDRPSSSSRPTQYPSSEPASNESSESYPNYGGDSTPSDTFPEVPASDPAEAEVKPEQAKAELDGVNRDDPVDDVEAPASSRAGKPD